MNAREGLTRMLAVFLLLAAFVWGLYGLARLFAPDYAKVTPRNLSRSVTRETGGGSALDEKPVPCARVRGEWSCFVPDNKGSGGGARYRVTMEDEHCWSAEKTLGGGELPKNAADCVTTEDLPD
jgi:hypothetical protein